VLLRTGTVHCERSSHNCEVGRDTGEYTMCQCGSTCRGTTVFLSRFPVDSMLNPKEGMWL
jgi:hypothetical protein